MLGRPVFGLGKAITSVDVAVIDANSEWIGVKRLQLMENAGRSVAEEAAKLAKPGSRVVVFAGPGGNGGDGLVAARHLAYMGYQVTVVMIVKPEEIRSPETRAMYEALAAMDLTVDIRIARAPADVAPVEADVVIDALLGTGLRGAPRPPYSDAIEAVNSSTGLKLAVDVPSGLNSDTGETPGAYVKADITVTFHKPKPGLLRRPDVAGRLVVVSIGAPPEAEVYVGPGDVAYRVRPRSWKAHKGSSGRVLIVGGSQDYVGAPILAALAAERSGVDLVFLAAPEHVTRAASHHPTIIPVPLRGSPNIHPDHVKKLEQLLDRVDAIAIGMGVGLSDETKEAIPQIIVKALEKEKPVVVDADGIKILGERGIPNSNRKLVVTPHQREFQILFGDALSGVDEDIKARALKAAEKAQRHGLVILLKGPIDIVTDGERIRLNRTGVPAMSVGGTGDTLAGITAALLARKLEPFHAASIAAFVNGLAGALAYAEKKDSMTAMDLIEKIPEALNNPIEAANRVPAYQRLVRGRIEWQPPVGRSES
ncbi:NAD(P)H-hydrate dehydratase [Hyperthermus butylicus]|uniref:Bifunctional NAD(P)H-hydrate repair enzyme Nnr n=1 Tax=Hyperthermus butylicus (strain DSM 5456 / JCM 9403 / PLM1-5) TaxID=415426 RepID=NNR_HYPBU|nr:NAD(P)H-hydrate dehydratase [Hyperthermus butylicus]A2BLC0.1 RecName: Full=Bifunctional NAD(P)H-hydrate repair enzyme Nnr; AltName: Full=Nicotinamide nucleotide repair protein; Includes: RecName: Full=ADP-dependent (S)-NAD(P)H-hydrate dehydratase; AltName: Full=ADP-dependent NAD(P)HX dehydratase; Includes: RecName: Full=NAD(P)H-hydrate epimerase; AltName: Full=NAD(P)HX epimerase [Hyperthermus butylicus DSM 5456]ABM80781.1 conserved archaeal protein [Hyperthermus butylicus DSM 5456]